MTSFEGIGQRSRKSERRHDGLCLGLDLGGTSVKGVAMTPEGIELGRDVERFDLEDVHVRKLSDGVVALAYKVKESLVVEGQDISMEAFDASVWVRRNGEWVCALHTESPSGDPFGRR